MIILSLSAAAALSLAGVLDQPSGSVTFTEDKNPGDLEVVFLEDDVTQIAEGQELMSVLEELLRNPVSGSTVSYDFQLPQSDLMLSLKTIGTASHIEVLNSASGDVVEAWTVSSTAENIPVDVVLLDVADRLGIATEGQQQVGDNRAARAE